MHVVLLVFTCLCVRASFLCGSCTLRLTFSPHEGSRQFESPSPCRSSLVPSDRKRDTRYVQTRHPPDNLCGPRFAGDPERDPDLVHARPYLRKSILAPAEQYDPFLVK